MLTVVTAADMDVGDFTSMAIRSQPPATIKVCGSLSVMLCWILLVLVM
jgi:hypothetical protein